MERRIKSDIVQLLRLAEKANVREIPDGMDVPHELARRETRLAAIADAKERIRVREQERIAAEQTEHDRKTVERLTRERETGKSRWDASLGVHRAR